MRCNLCKTLIVEIDNSYLYCKDCGLYQINNIKEYSAENSSWGSKDEIVENYLSGKKWRKKIFKDRLNLIKLLHPNMKTLLDVGSATGLFASIVEIENIKVDVVEPYRAFKEYSIDINKSISHFDDINDVDTRYDFITIFDTFGYSKNLTKSLDKLSTLLNVGGYLMITSGWVDDGMNSVHDFSFNYYFKSKFWKECFPQNSKLELVKFWTENKNFNTKKYGTQEWWRDYLMLNNEIKMNYIVYRKV